MNVLVIYSHPNPASFNSAILGVVKDELAKRNVPVKVKDLYAMNWDPVLSGSDLEQMAAGKVPDDIAREQKDVSWADLLIFISPVWWYSVTAIMKGYIERVMSLGFAYEDTEQGSRGLMQGKRALFLTTLGADEQTARDTGMIDALKISLINGFGKFCGFDEVVFKGYYAVPFVSDEERKKMLENVRSVVANMVFLRE